MPFDRYLQPSHDRESQSYPTSAEPSAAGTQAYARSSYDDDSRAAMFGIGSSNFTGNVQFQMPQFMYAGPPTLAPGGGAEVLPAGFMSMPGSMTSSWYTNSGFTPKTVEEIDTTLPSKYQPSPYSTLSAHLSPEDPSSGVAARSSLPSHIPPHAPSHPHALALDTNLTDVLAAATQASQIGPSLSAPSSLNLPVYSSSGFDLLSILGRVATRQNPKIVLGPVDMSCSFVVVDVRRFDSPIVYASATFCRLTGYDEQEVLGRNCRFLQAPNGQVQKGEPRRYTAPEAVHHLRKCLVADKECQTSIINYKKDGTAFINLVTVIPVTGGVSNGQEEADDVVYHVGFQVDLSEQPNAILQKLRDGSYMVNYSSNYVGALPMAGYSSRDRRNKAYSTNALSKTLRNLLEDETFIPSVSAPPLTDDKADWYEGNQPLSLLLLDATPDFPLVLSLKGSFLYVAPSVCRILGYNPEELAGKSVVDYCHTSDVVPLMRELKESSSVSAGTQEGYNHNSTGLVGLPKSVNLLFRARTKLGGYTWMECRGRLHVEPGKGRKAIILSARPRSMPHLDWKTTSTVNQSVSGSSPTQDQATSSNQEVWGMLSTGGTVLFMGAAIKDILGWGVAEVIGMSVRDLMDRASQKTIEDALGQYATRSTDLPTSLLCKLNGKSDVVSLNIVLYPPSLSSSSSHNDHLPIVCQLTSAPRHPMSGPSGHENVFQELETLRSSSWQFELQQLKIENQQLCDEIEQLESTIASSQGQRLAPATSADSGSYQQDSQFQVNVSPPNWV
ncbi:hypothetical protein EVG20_g6130 [Dentipellis fragilis]|uniref:PAS domain-containing protein n=1 Tax=Dentipellis fragilis TaxID=205917 RepID=A0A4Y9YQ33_9AGAM|nr:hypothetical protein EVG20_g6130 [Dentipellis fragilis]